MLRALVAAVLICALSLPGLAQSRRGDGGGGMQQHSPRGHSQRRRGRGYQAPDNPLGSFLGGILGGWLANQLRPKEEPPEEYDDERE